MTIGAQACPALKISGAKQFTDNLRELVQVLSRRNHRARAPSCHNQCGQVLN